MHRGYRIYYTGIFLFLFLLPRGISSALESSSFWGEVCSSRINVRADATVNSPVIYQANKGDYVEVVLELYDWYKIRLPAFAPAFIRKDLVILQDTKTARVLGTRVNIRLAANEDSWIIGKADKTELVTILKESGSWYKIEPSTNCFGWIHKKFVNKTAKKIELPLQEITPVESKLEETKTAGITLEGVIQPYGKVFKRQATHKIIDKERKIFLLKGNKETLESFTHRRVRVIGKPIDSAQQKYPLIEVIKVELLE